MGFVKNFLKCQKFENMIVEFCFVKIAQKLNIGGSRVYLLIFYEG